MGGHWHVSKIALFHFRVCILLYLEYVRNRYGVFVGYSWDIRGVFTEYSWDIRMYRVCVGYVSGMYRECVERNRMRNRMRKGKEKITKYSKTFGNVSKI